MIQDNRNLDLARPFLFFISVKKNKIPILEPVQTKYVFLASVDVHTPYQVNAFCSRFLSNVTIWKQLFSPILEVNMFGKFPWKIRVIATNLEVFYPPKGRLLTDSSRGPIVFYLWIIWLRKGILHFQFPGGFLPFWDLENVLSPEGTSACRLQ